ncbi:UNVERIFIED_CONTAM: hypothetical protein Sindi_2319800 [Sesamum indicum]
MTPDENGGEFPVKVDVEYEWLPPKCTYCMTLGHSAKDCALQKKSKTVKAPVSVYVLKVGGSHQSMPERRVEKPVDRKEVEETEMREIPKNAAGPSREERAIWNICGLNKQDHQLAVKDIVAEFRLHFLGLLETRVGTNNITCIQSFLMPHWKWYVDPISIGNRIWIAWHDNIVDVDVLEMGAQFLHCRVNIRALQESIAVTVIYGATDVPNRQELWSCLESLAIQCTDIPWLVGGDFNAIRDLSEVCGTSGDIRMAMDEFNTCFQNTAHLPLPMQGEWYTWYNRSTSPRNLWKRLDRMLTDT